ncbi:hypothetical protein B0J13DRAFT_469438 [Dactylonectria estremocensis]|uniref:Uncharacterized protein n=1 Tax=Dactylonectria estremocensis TaxID=1079267 RepID=A0A9P9F7K5_9HYPO|nr:hypothetical protein B0J13DRAFT_469438 [Dactylonectria estremocensis]
MAPLCADPRQIVISLNPARRKALYKLVHEITSYMIAQLETPENELGPVALGTPRDDGEGSKTNDDEFRNREQQVRNRAPHQAQKIQKAAMKHMSDWKRELMPKLEEIARVPDDSKILGERQKRLDAIQKSNLDTPEEGENLISFGEVKIDKSQDVISLQALYHPIPTRLTTIPQQDRREAIVCILLLLLSTGKYSAYSRTLALYLASALEVPQAFVVKQEIEIAKSLLESSMADDKQKEAMSAEAEAEKRRHDNKFNRFWKVGLASVAGAAVIGVTGGLAAPLVAGAIGGVLGGVGLGGVASFLGIFWMNGALVGALFGAYGAKMTGEMMDEYAKEVEDFRFIPLKDEWGQQFQAQGQKAEQDHRLRVTIGINGWLNTEDDITKPWRVLNDDAEVFALRYELKSLMALGSALRALVESFAWNTIKMEILKRTVLATLLAALWPVQVLAAASNVDNPFNRAHNRSRKAGRLLADALINKVQGERPVTLVGYSLGATAIHACLQSLAQRHAFGLIDSVVIIGAPAPSTPTHWRTLRTVVSGKIFNVYSENDMVLGFLYRAHSLSAGVAGLQAVNNVEGVENLNLSETVSGHLRYPDLIGEILCKCGFVGIKAGAEIEKDELIKMKEHQVDESLIDFDAAPSKDVEAKRSPSQAQLTDDLRGLNISPPGLVSPSVPPPTEEKSKDPDAEKPPLPQRLSGEGIDSPSVLPRSSTAASGNDQTLFSRLAEREAENVEEKAPLPKRPTERAAQKAPASQIPPRSLTPETNVTDDEEYGGIVMVSYDSSDEDGPVHKRQ